MSGLLRGREAFRIPIIQNNLAIEIHKIVFPPVTLLREAFLSVLCPFLYIVTFLCSSISSEPFNCFTSHFTFWYSWYYPESYLTKETVLEHLPLCWETFWSILGLILGYAYVFLRAASCLMKFCTDVFWKSIKF